MASLTPYRKDLDVVNGATGDAGIALTDNFKALANGTPLVDSVDPTASDDSTFDFGVGSLWMNSTSGTLWMCVDATATAAVWKALLSRSNTALTLIPTESSGTVDVAGRLTVSGHDAAGTSMLVSSAGGAVAKFENTSASMQLFVDGFSDSGTPNSQASFQLRSQSDPGNNRTLFARMFSTHSSAPDFLNIQHVVGGATICTLTMTGTGNFRVLPNGNIGLGVAVPKAKLHSSDSTIVGAAASAVADADLSNSQLNFFIDETNNQLKFKVKYSNGTVKSGSVSLT